MNKFWIACGTVAYYLSWPALFVYFFFSRRTRVILRKGDSVLCFKSWYNNGRWLLPGGGLHKGESVIDGAIRETREEIGLTLHPKDLHERGSFRTKNGFRYVYCVVECMNWDESQLSVGLGNYQLSWVPIDILLQPGKAEASVRESLERFTKK